jgi:phospholipase B1
MQRVLLSLVFFFGLSLQALPVIDIAQLENEIRGVYPSLNDSQVPEFARLLLRQQEFLTNSTRNSELRAPVPFKCTIIPPSPQVPTSVHKLTPGDIKVVGALGDSLTAGFGAKSKSIITVFTEYRGIAFPIGGDGTVADSVTVPNIIKKYNPNLIGFSTGTGNKDSANSKFNRAITGAEFATFPSQAQDLINKIKADSKVNIQNDWKMVTLFIGANDLCHYCENNNKYSPLNYQNTFRQTLRILRDNLPRLFINVITSIDVTKLYELSGGLCSLLHSYECPCGTSNDANVRKQVSQINDAYNAALQSLVNEAEFNNKDDFSVVVQPFLVDTDIPRSSNGSPNLDYFAPDCFHFSYLSHDAAGIALWNNIIEPIPTKLTKWTIGEPIDCIKQGEYLATKQNSL